MERMRGVTMVFVVAATVLAGCGGSTASAEPDEVVAPEELARLLAEDRETAYAAYEGKVLELTGTVGEKIRPGGLNPTMGIAFAEIGDELAFDADLSFVSFDPEDGAARSEFEALEVGQAVTLHCVLRRLNDSGSLLTVERCRVAR